MSAALSMRFCNISIAKVSICHKGYGLETNRLFDPQGRTNCVAGQSRFGVYCLMQTKNYAIQRPRGGVLRDGDQRRACKRMLAIVTPLCSECTTQSLRMQMGEQLFLSERSPLRQLPQHRMQNSAVAVVDDFNRRVDAAGSDEVDLVAVGFLRRDFDGLARLQFVAQADVEDFGAVEIQ